MIQRCLSGQRFLMLINSKPYVSAQIDTEKFNTHKYKLFV